MVVQRRELGWLNLKSNLIMQFDFQETKLAFHGLKSYALVPDKPKKFLSDVLTISLYWAITFVMTFSLCSLWQWLSVRLWCKWQWGLRRLIGLVLSVDLCRCSATMQGAGWCRDSQGLSSGRHW